MNILLWILQILLALHTAIGAVWKFSNTPEQTEPSLKVIPVGAWKSMSVIELLCSVALILPIFSESLAILTPCRSGHHSCGNAVFCGIHIYSSAENNGPIIYWLVVAVIGVFIAYSRFVLKPF